MKKQQEENGDLDKNVAEIHLIATIEAVRNSIKL